MSRICRTRYQCAGCGVPLCLIDNGKVDNDCFTIAHETAERQELVCKKYDKMKKKKKTTRQKLYRFHVQNLTRIPVVVSVINNSSLLMGW
jgi:GTP-binding protein EngB required for normal cell division